MKARIMMGVMLLLFFVVGFSVTWVPNAVAASKDDVCAALNAGSTTAAGPGNCDGVHNGVTVEGIVKVAVQIISWIVGVAAVIMVIVGGLQYVTSGGDSGKVTSAKNMIMYALIGLVIVALAQVIVNFTINKATQP